MSHSQAFWSRVAATVLVFRRVGCTVANKSGSWSVMERPSSHASSQNHVERLSPITQRIEELKKVVVTASSCKGCAAHGLA
jgi:hypothetical protein